ncbi:MAG: hypothetical protein KY455_06075 [Euryarchaeota archaeon]|nr:hypothetical protein [Euryarchaeota archaeon]
MNPSGLDRLVDGLFDHAGMFPPAELEFESALRDAARFPETLTRPHLVATDMVLTPKTLPSLDSAILQEEGFTEGRTCTVCLVGVSLADAERQARSVHGFNSERAEDPVPQRIVSLETTSEASGPDAIAQLAIPLDITRAMLGPDTRLYIEPRWDKTIWTENIDDLFTILATVNSAGPKVGLKVRCAGPTEVDHETLTGIIQRVVQGGVPFKATQGLHHPVIEPERYGNAHGFLNVTTALYLHAIHGTAFAADLILACLKNEEAKAFTFDDGVTWNGHRLDGDALRTAKETLPFTIGSCSLVEPDQDLVRLFPQVEATTPS